MTEVQFHVNVPDKVHYACRLLRKAQASGARIGVLAPPDVLDALDVALWRFSATDFVAHCRADAPPAMRAASPIVLAQDCAALDADRVLLHLGRELPDGFERFARLIELVGADPEDLAQGRLRWRHYAAHGHSPRRHDVAQPAEHHDPR